MKTYIIRFMTAVPALASSLLLSVPAPGQTNTQSAKAQASPATLGRTADGQPDVRGVWVTVHYGMGCLSNPATGVGCVPEDTGRGNRQPPAKAPSRIIDTPDGEIPYQAWAREREKYLLANFFEPTKPEFIDPQQRCLPLGAVRQLTWHDVQILQYPGYVILEHEGTHMFRLIPLDGRPHAGQNIKLWMGDSRGHWEGNTLVVDVTNNNSKGRLSRAGDFASDKVHIVEHFKFLDGDTLQYEALFDDPSVYTKPWTFGFDMKRGFFGEENPNGADDKHYEQWEEACYEGMNSELDGALRTNAAGK